MKFHIYLPPSAVAGQKVFFCLFFLLSFVFFFLFFSFLLFSFSFSFLFIFVDFLFSPAKNPLFLSFFFYYSLISLLYINFFFMLLLFSHFSCLYLLTSSPGWIFVVLEWINLHR